MRLFEVEDTLERAGSSYDIVVLAAKRAQQIKDGARPLVEVESNNPLTIALHEIAMGKVVVEPADESQEEDQAPQRRERHYLTQRGALQASIQETEANQSEAEDE